MADELSRAGKMREIIMVAVDNSRDRYLELCGRLTMQTQPPTLPMKITRRCSSTELKPYIDRLPDLARRAPHGSDGLLNGWHQQPDAGVGTFRHFWGAASLSGAFQVEHNQFLNGVLKEYAGRPDRSLIS